MGTLQHRCDSLSPRAPTAEPALNGMNRWLDIVQRDFWHWFDEKQRGFLHLSTILPYAAPHCQWQRTRLHARRPDCIGSPQAQSALSVRPALTTLRGVLPCLKFLNRTSKWTLMATASLWTLLVKRSRSVLLPMCVSIPKLFLSPSCSCSVASLFSYLRWKVAKTLCSEVSAVAMTLRVGFLW